MDVGFQTTLQTVHDWNHPRTLIGRLPFLEGLQIDPPTAVVRALQIPKSETEAVQHLRVDPSTTQTEPVVPEPAALVDQGPVVQQLDMTPVITEASLFEPVSSVEEAASIPATLLLPRTYSELMVTLFPDMEIDDDIWVTLDKVFEDPLPVQPAPWRLSGFGGPVPDGEVPIAQLLDDLLYELVHQQEEYVHVCKRLGRI